MLVSAKAMQAGLTLLKPHLTSGETKSAGKVAVGTVKGDLHDIRKNLVAMMLEGAQIIGMSALLTTTMGKWKRMVPFV